MCISTSPSCLETCKCLISVSSQNFNVSTQSQQGRAREILSRSRTSTSHAHPCQLLHCTFYLRRRRRLCFWCGLIVCLSVCPSDYSQTCERILTKFFVGVGPVGHNSRTTLQIRESKVRNPDPPYYSLIVSCRFRRRFVLSERILVLLYITGCACILYKQYKLHTTVTN